MKSTADRYQRLAQSYITLSDQFNQLDVAHMNLKHKVVPVIKALKKYQALTQLLKQDKANLEQTIQTLTEEKDMLQGEVSTLQAKYSAIAELEVLLQPDHQELLLEAEQQLELIEETLQEMSIDSVPDLNEADKQLLESCQTEAESWAVAEDSVESHLAAQSTDVKRMSGLVSSAT